MWAETVSGKLVDFPKASQQIQKKNMAAEMEGRCGENLLRASLPEVN